MGAGRFYSFLVLLTAVVLTAGTASAFFAVSKNTGGSDNPTLQQVLGDGNSAGSHSIDMNGNNIFNIGTLNTNGNQLKVGGDINMTGNRIMNVTSVEPGDAVNKSYVDTSDDTINDDQNLQDVLSNGNSTGNYDINLNGNRLLTGGSMINITDSTNNQDIVRFKEGGGIQVPNGKINMSGNSVEGLDWVTYRDRGGNNVEFYVQEDANNRLQFVENSGDNAILRLTEGGNAEIPNGRLHVTSGTHAGLRIEDTATSGTDVNEIRIDTANGGGMDIEASDLSVANPTWQWRTFSSEDIAFYPGGTQTMKLDNGGNVEIPNGNLLMKNGNAIKLDNGYFRFRNSSGEQQFALDWNMKEAWIWDDMNNDRVINFNKGGNVELPNGHLQMTEGNAIKDNGGVSRISIASTQTTLKDEEGDNVFLANGGDSARIAVRAGEPLIVYDYSTSPITQLAKFSIGGPVELPQEDASDNVLEIGNAGSDFSGDIVFNQGNGNSAELRSQQTWLRAVIGNGFWANDVKLDSFSQPGSDSMCWDGSGASLIGDCSSLRKYKNNISDLELGLKTVNRMRPRRFVWDKNMSGEEDIGFIAEEVKAVNPIIADYNGDNLTGVKYRQYTAVLTNAVQQLDDKNRQLKQQNERLEERVDRLERLVCQDHPDAEVCN